MPFGYLEKALPGAQLGLPPQARVGRLRAVLPQEGKGIVVPYDPPAGVLYHARIQRADQPAVGVIEIFAIFKRQTVHSRFSPRAQGRRPARPRTGWELRSGFHAAQHHAAMTAAPSRAVMVNNPMLDARHHPAHHPPWVKTEFPAAL